MDQTSVAPLERFAPERLLDAAASLFWHQGYAATTTREIAAALGIQQASLYHHMSSKEDLLYEICRSSIGQFLDQVPPAVQRAEGLERIHILIQTHMAVLLRYQDRNVTMLTDLRSVARRRGVEMVALRDQYESFVRFTLEDGQSAGILRTDVDARYLDLACMNMLNFAALWFRKERTLSQERVALMFTQLFLEGAAARREDFSWTLPGPDLDSEPAGERSARSRKMPQAADRNPALDRALDAAVTLFSRKGYSATSTREVAAALGIQKASLYYHISKKEDLLYLICTDSLERIRHDVETAIADVQDPMERIRALITAHMESLLRDADRHSTTFTEMRSLSEDRLAHVRSLRSSHEDLVRSVLQEAQSAGALRGDIPVKYLCLGLLGIMNRTTVWFRRNGALSARQVGQLFGSIFLAGASAPSIGASR